jgi:fructose-specific phosphotransferase system IIC component
MYGNIFNNMVAGMVGNLAVFTATVMAEKKVQATDRKKDSHDF